jgi:UPF0716 protein FxsA
MIARTTTAGVHPLWLALAGILLLPFLEFAAFFWVAGRIGFIPALVALVATSFLGASLLRRQGSLAISRLAAAFRRGEPPHGPARESFLVALGGVLMIIPGFVTDAIGFALIVPSLLRGHRQASAAPKVRRQRPRGKGQGPLLDLERGEWQSLDDSKPL